MSAVIVAPNVRDLKVMVRELAVWISAQMPYATDVELKNPSYPSGAGQSHETVLFDLSWRKAGRAFSRGYVVRIKPSTFTVYPDNLFDQQYHIMRVLNKDGRVHVAKPTWLEPDASILGAPFFVMERIYGRVAVSVPPYAQVGWVVEASAHQRAKMWQSGVRQLAAIQKVPRSLLDFLEGPEGARSGLEQEWDKYSRFLRWISTDRQWPPLEAAHERLQRQWPKNQPPGLVWGDARIGNMMFNDGFDVVAVMDWEQPSLGGALNDLAWWLLLSQMMHCHPDGRPKLDGFGTREETITLWHELTGISTADIEWYEDFTRLKIACLEIRTAALRGQPAPDEAGMARRLRL